MSYIVLFCFGPFGIAIASLRVRGGGAGLVFVLFVRLFDLRLFVLKGCGL